MPVARLCTRAAGEAVLTADELERLTVARDMGGGLGPVLVGVGRGGGRTELWEDVEALCRVLSGPFGKFFCVRKGRVRAQQNWRDEAE